VYAMLLVSVENCLAERDSGGKWALRGGSHHTCNTL
jgi:hypothetical protein